MKFKKVALISAVVAAGLSLSACSSSNNESSSAKSTQTSKKNLVLQIKLFLRIKNLEVNSIRSKLEI